MREKMPLSQFATHATCRRRQLGKATRANARATMQMDAPAVTAAPKWIVFLGQHHRHLIRSDQSLGMARAGEYTEHFVEPLAHALSWPNCGGEAPQPAALTNLSGAQPRLSLLSPRLVH